jgi:NAD(P)-dependent dehydrogenase (short-subunit alcohol dehydrogenase family)
MKATELFDVSGNVAIVTGAASGLGRAMAEVMAANGARVVLVDIDAAALTEASAAMRATGGAIEAITLDVRDRDALTAAIDGIVARYGRLDAVFANAGSSAGPGFQFMPSGNIEAVTAENWDNILKLNLTSVFVTMQVAARHMKVQKSGRIIVTASIAGIRAEPVVGYPYIATKAAVANLVRQAAIELAPYNVLVNAIAPGPFFTNIAGGRLRIAEVASAFAETVPLKRIASPDEIKGLALYLASGASSFMTGVVIPIDGGTTAM